MEKAIFTVRVPLTFEFVGDAKLERQKLLDEAERQIRKAIKKGYFSTHNVDLEVIRKKRILTEKQKREIKEFWESIGG